MTDKIFEITHSEIISPILQQLYKFKIVKLDRVLPPVSRSLWITLPEDIQELLEKAHGYSHYNPKTDMIETSHDCYSTFKKMFDEDLEPIKVQTKE